jgi:hypothetical protein
MRNFTSPTLPPGSPEARDWKALTHVVVAQAVWLATIAFGIYMAVDALFG